MKPSRRIATPRPYKRPNYTAAVTKEYGDYQGWRYGG
jgi:hypothetical protein